jgi:hypothetical protein
MVCNFKGLPWGVNVMMQWTGMALCWATVLLKSSNLEDSQSAPADREAGFGWPHDVN